MCQWASHTLSCRRYAPTADKASTGTVRSRASIRNSCRFWADHSRIRLANTVPPHRPAGGSRVSRSRRMSGGSCAQTASTNDRVQPTQPRFAVCHRALPLGPGRTHRHAYRLLQLLGGAAHAAQVLHHPRKDAHLPQWDHGRRRRTGTASACPGSTRYRLGTPRAPRSRDRRQTAASRSSRPRRTWRGSQNCRAGGTRRTAGRCRAPARPAARTPPAHPRPSRRTAVPSHDLLSAHADSTSRDAVRLATRAAVTAGAAPTRLRPGRARPSVTGPSPRPSRARAGQAGRAPRRRQRSSRAGRNDARRGSWWPRVISSATSTPKWGASVTPLCVTTR